MPPRAQRFAPLEATELLGPARYAAVRTELRREVILLKRPRRVELGDRATVVFENRETVRFQIEEVLRAESITAPERVQAELDAYNPLLPDESSLSATLFLEIPRPHERDPRAALHALSAIADRVTFVVAAERIRPTRDVHPGELGAVSAVHFLRYPLSPTARALLVTPRTDLALEVDHPSYTHRVTLAESTRASLAADYL